MSAGSENLKSNQRQLDMDGCEVGVSRQAVDETLEEYASMLAALKEAHRALTHYEWYAVDANGVRANNEAAIAKAEGTTP